LRIAPIQRAVRHPSRNTNLPHAPSAGEGPGDPVRIRTAKAGASEYGERLRHIVLVELRHHRVDD